MSCTRRYHTLYWIFRMDYVLVCALITQQNNGCAMRFAFTGYD